MADLNLLDSPAYLQSLPAASAQPDPPSSPQTTKLPSFSDIPHPLTDMYIKLRAQGLADSDAALKVAQHLRQVNDIRATFREAGDAFAQKPNDPGYRTQLMAEAERPITDLAERRKAGPYASEEMGRQLGAMGSDIAMNQQVGMLSPEHPANRVLQDMISKAVPGLPPDQLAKITASMYPQLAPAVSSAITRATPTLQPPATAESQLAAAAKTRAEAKGVPAAVAKTKAETAAIPPGIAKTEAETGKTQAEAALDWQKVGGTVAPGWRRTSEVGGVGDDEIKGFRTQAAAAANSARLIDQLNGLLKGSDFLTDRDKVAKAGVLSNQLLLASKQAAGIRGLPAQDVAFLTQMVGDFSTFNVKNLLGLSKNPTRLKMLKSTINSALETDAKSMGIAPVGGEQGPGASNEHSDAIKWAKEHPQDPRSAKILSTALTKGDSVAGL